MNTIKEKISELNRLILDGKAMEGFEKFYHPTVIMQENEGQPTIGKDANRKRELEFWGNVTDLRYAQIKAVAVGQDHSTVVWHYDYDHKDWGTRNYTQVSVQTWSDGQIIKEQFFYGS
jgi:SnoaL-like domain